MRALLLLTATFALAAAAGHGADKSQRSVRGGRDAPAERDPRLAWGESARDEFTFRISRCRTCCTPVHCQPTARYLRNPPPRAPVAENPKYRAAANEIASRPRRECSGIAVPIASPDDVKAVAIPLVRNESTPDGACPIECNNFCQWYGQTCCGFDGLNCYCCPYQTSCCA